MSSHKLVLCQDGSVKGWGYNSYGQLGTAASYVSTPVPIYLSLPASIVQLAVTYGSSFAILADGTLWAWGNNGTGQLGIGSSVSSTATPTLVPGLTNVVSVSGGFHHTIALQADGTVWSWGKRQDSALGTGSSGAAVVYAPQQIGTLANVRAIASGDQFALALDAGGHVWAWGMDAYGELGLGLSGTIPTMQWVPAQLALADVRQIEACNVRAGAVRANGTVYNWGNNSVGQLGLGHSNLVTTPAQVGAGTLTNIVALALNNVSSCAVQADGQTYVWGTNDHGSLGVPTPAAASTPIAGPVFSPNVQISGSSDSFTSTERDGTVKLWGNGPIGYSPVNPSPYGGSYTPTTPGNLCLAVPPVVSFPVCGPQRAYYQRSGATYTASAHGNIISPAEIGTPGTTTVIDASLPPYNGSPVVFDGLYHIRGDVQLINGTFSALMNTIFYVDGSSGQSRAEPYYSATTLDVQNATLQLRGATLQANCPEPWGGITLTGGGKLYTEAVLVGKRTYRPTIRDAATGVYSFTADWRVANTNEYYLRQTDFLYNDIGLYDLVKGTAQPGEGARNCSFQEGRVGVQFESVDYAPTKVYGGDYAAAAFDANSFTSLHYGMLGQAGGLHVTNSSFSKNYLSAINVVATGTNGGEIHRNTVVVPAVWPAAVLALYGSTAPESAGIVSSGPVKITANSVAGATATPASNSIRQVGMYLGSGARAFDGNVVRVLDDGIIAGTSDNFGGSSHYLVGNTLSENVVGLRFTGYSFPGYATTPPQVTLQCNTLSSTQPNAVGVWVMAGTPFPSSLGSSAQPNGNRFNGIADVTKRFVYDATGPFQYHRYASSQEQFGTTNSTNTGDVLFNSSGQPNPPAIAANNTSISGSGACGTSATPGVYARSAGADSPAGSVPALASPEVQLGLAHPNPASEIVSFSYILPTKGTASRVVMRDVLGHVVESTLLSGLQGEVHSSVANLPNGFYTVALEVDSRIVATQKLIVQH